MLQVRRSIDGDLIWYRGMCFVVVRCRYGISLLFFFLRVFFQAYKYIPYGKVGETIPYLLRRAQENSGMLGGASHERGLLVKEIRRRVFGG